MFTASEIEKYSQRQGLSPGTSGLLGGMGGGIAQAYATMGECFRLSQEEQSRCRIGCSSSEREEELSKLELEGGTEGIC